MDYYYYGADKKAVKTFSRVFMGWELPLTSVNPQSKGAEWVGESFPAKQGSEVRRENCQWSHCPSHPPTHPYPPTPTPVQLTA